MQARINSLICVLVLAIIPISEASAQKIVSGSSCRVVKQKIIYLGKTYTCVKSKNQLVWNKGVAALTRDSTKPQSGKSFTPWSTAATGKEISDAAQKSFRDWAKDQSDKPYKHQLIIQENVFPNRAKSLRAADTTGSRLFSQYFSTKSTTVIGSSEDWVVEKLNLIGGSFRDCSISYIKGLDWCWDGNSVQGMVVFEDLVFDPQNLGRDGSSLLAHEYFHLIQSQLTYGRGAHLIKDGSPSTANWFPAWLIEGSADFVGYSVASLAMGTDYWQGRQNMNYPSNQNALEDAEIRTFLGNQPNGPIEPYNIGRVATEFLVASVGFQKFIEIFVSFRETKNFELSFEKVTGISKVHFYEKFELVRTRLGMPKVSMKLICLSNVPLKDVPRDIPNCEIKTTLP